MAFSPNEITRDMSLKPKNVNVMVVRHHQRIHPLRSKNVCTEPQGNPSGRCWDISLWSKVVDWITVRHCRPAYYGIWSQSFPQFHVKEAKKNSGKSQTEARVEKAGQKKWIQKKRNLAASRDTRQSIGIFVTTGFHLMHFCQSNYDWHAITSACWAGCHVTVSLQRVRENFGNQSVVGAAVAREVQWVVH